MSRLYISNSKNLFLTIVFFVVCGLALTQFYYDYKGAPIDYGHANYGNFELKENTINTIAILGDSRAGAAFVPYVFDNKISNSKTVNISTRGGSLYGMMRNIINSGKQFKLIILCVSPASLFGSFVHDSLEYKFTSVNLKTPDNGNLNERISLKLNNIFLGKSKFTYGFAELKNLILHGNISHFYTADGWESNLRFGSSARYARTYNYYGYKNHLLCNSGNIELINKFKNDFREHIKKLIANQKLIIVRLPVSPDLKHLEDERFPWFDSFISETAGENSIAFLNNFSDSYTSDISNDGSHLSHHQAIRFSESFTDTLKMYLNR